MEISREGDSQGSRNTRERVRDEIIRQILTEKIGPGSRINETALALELGVSQTPVREALLRLEGEGVVQSRRGHGFQLPILDKGQMRDLYAIIAALEAVAIRSSHPIAPSTVDELRIANQDLAGASSIRDMIARDFGWHEILVGSSSNQQAVSMAESLRILALRHEFAFWDRLDAVHVSVAHHEEITAQLEAGEVESAIAMLFENWMQGVESCSVVS